MQDIAIFGAGGFGLEVLMLVEQINAVAPTWRPIGFFDDGTAPGTLVNGLPVLGGRAELEGWERPLAVALAVGQGTTRRKIREALTNPRLSFPVLRHPSVISGQPAYVAIGEGTILCAGTILTTNLSLGRHVILNLACTVGHETRIGDFASFMPSCNISGDCEIGEESYWGTGAIVIQGKRVGRATTVGAGAVVVSDVPDGVTVVGVPARPLAR